MSRRYPSLLGATLAIALLSCRHATLPPPSEVTTSEVTTSEEARTELADEPVSEEATESETAEPLAAMRAEVFTDADFAAHVRAVRQRLAELEHEGGREGERYTVLVERPFVVIGDEAPERVRARSKNTVRWAVDHLKRSYFERDPLHIIDVWLFRDKTSYEWHAKQLFDDEPGTPFGYYSSRERALVMNISTGGGTLVHEIVHPFIESNFPACPSWFNEGLASLYEQCGERAGRIRGATNWRLAGLQEAIRAGRVPSFETLTSTTTDQFYNADPGTNYSQARYLCYWLQEHGKLREYYRRFRDGHREDPSGYATLESVIGVSDLAAWQKSWEAWILEQVF